MISVAENRRKTYIEWLGSGELTKQVLIKNSEQRKPRPWDGFIHSSKLDWTRSHHKQFEDHLKGGFTSDNMMGPSRAGDIYHEDLQKLYDLEFPNATIEGRIRIDQMRFQGTPDRISWNTPIGNILHEFKSIDAYQRDATRGKHLWGKVSNLLHDFRHITKKEDGTIYRGILGFTEKELADIEVRLNSTERIAGPSEDHLTQMFTYAWVAPYVYQRQIDWCVLTYVKRNNYDTVDFVYPVSQCQDLIQKAAHNFNGVYQCLVQHYQQSISG